MHVIHEAGCRPIKHWAGEVPAPESVLAPQAYRPDIEDSALAQLRNVASLPFIHRNGIAVMPDVHWGMGATIGSVIATTKAIIPAAVGVDIGCGMNAVRTSLTASDLPDNLAELRHSIERGVPTGFGQHNDHNDTRLTSVDVIGLRGLLDRHFEGDDKLFEKAARQLGTLGGGNHFIELCLDEAQQVWIMLHSGSRGIGNVIGRRFIERAKRHAEAFFIVLPDKDLAYLAEGTQDFDDYCEAVEWAQAYAFANRRAMMYEVLRNMAHHIPKLFTIDGKAVECHHNYIARESHFGDNVWVTRKGAIRAREGDMGIIPGARGARSYIVRGKGNAESYCSCSHGAGRVMSRTEARRRFTQADLAETSKGIECSTDVALVDEIRGAYKDIDQVMENQRDLVEIVHTLSAVMNIKGVS